MTIHTVLLTPAEGDPHGLLANGVLGAATPAPTAAVCDNCRNWRVHAGLGFCTCDGWTFTSSRRSLVLAWDGEQVAEGLDRYCRILHMDRGILYSRVLGVLREGHSQVTADMTRGRGLGSIVLLDADGREVAP